jgi:carbamate kinase
MLIVIALGGNALLRRGQPLTEVNQLENIQRATAQIAQLATDYQLVITHGNGPQIGLLALQNAADPLFKPYPLDLLGAETDGLIGYLLEQELSNQLSPERVVATVLTRIEVDAHDPAFSNPTKPIGVMYSYSEVEHLAHEKSWVIKADGDGYRRVVASPMPKKILGLDPILWLLEHHVIVIAAGGGGIPVVLSADGHSYQGANAIIDKDLCSALLAEKIDAQMLLIATDVKAVFVDWGKPTQRAIRRIAPQDLQQLAFPDGSMGPKVAAACQFVTATGHPVAIGSLEEILELIEGRAGTWVCTDCPEPVYEASPPDKM